MRSNPAQANLRGLCSGAWRRYNHREIPLNVIVPDAGSMPLPATWISGRLLVGYGGFVENQNPRLNYKQYLMLTVEKGRITKREFQDRKLWIQ